MNFKTGSKITNKYSGREATIEDITDDGVYVISTEWLLAPLRLSLRELQANWIANPF